MTTKKTPTKIKAFKVFNKDWTCRYFKFEVGKKYKHDGEVKLCRGGFHACEKMLDCFNYYSFDPQNKVAEVILSGKIDRDEDGDKVCAEKIEIVREISWEEMLTLVNAGKGNTGKANSGDQNSGHQNSGDQNSGDRNSGDQNSGHQNSGDRNSGDRNSGDQNSGHQNSGDQNSGHWNSGSKNVGHLNSKTPTTISVFNKPCKEEVWENAEKPNFFYQVTTTRWIPKYQVTDAEKKANPNFFVSQGYLKRFTYHEAWAEAFKDASKSDITALKKLPNFNAKVFQEITGIEIK